MFHRREVNCSVSVYNIQNPSRHKFTPVQSREELLLRVRFPKSTGCGACRWCRAPHVNKKSDERFLKNELSNCKRLYLDVSFLGLPPKFSTSRTALVASTPFKARIAVTCWVKSPRTMARDLSVPYLPQAARVSSCTGCGPRFRRNMVPFLFDSIS